MKGSSRGARFTGLPSKRTNMSSAANQEHATRPTKSASPMAPASPPCRRTRIPRAGSPQSVVLDEFSRHRHSREIFQALYPSISRPGSPVSGAIDAQRQGQHVL